MILTIDATVILYDTKSINHLFICTLIKSSQKFLINIILIPVFEKGAGTGNICSIMA